MTNCNNRNPKPPCNKGFIKKEKLLKSGKKTKCCYKSKVKTVKKCNNRNPSPPCEEGFELRPESRLKGCCYKIKKDYSDCSNRNPNPPCKEGLSEYYNQNKKRNCCYKTKKSTKISPSTKTIKKTTLPVKTSILVTITSIDDPDVKEGLQFKIMTYTKVENMLKIYAKKKNTTLDSLGFFHDMGTRFYSYSPLKKSQYKKNAEELDIKNNDVIYSFIRTPFGEIPEYPKNEGRSKNLEKKNKKSNKPKKSNFKSYLPSIYEKYNIKSLSSTEPDPDVFNCYESDPDDIAVKNNEKNRWDCHSWDSPISQKAMLTNLHTKFKAPCSEIIPPTQRNSNCWFNSFVMIFFISDKGRKFFRILRETMITGKLPDGTELNKNLKKPFFNMNKFIDSFLLGTNNKLKYANRVDTNEFIDKISKHYKLLPPNEQEDYSTYLDVANKKTEVWGSIFYEVDQAGNPYVYYKSLLKLIGFEPFSMLAISGKNPKEFNDHIEWHVSNYQKLPHIIVAEYYDTAYYKRKRNSFYIPTEFEYKDSKWVLDSAVLRDKDQKHFSSYVTCNGNSYLFDGGAINKFYQHDWKNYINTKEKWKTGPELTETFSFSSGYQLLFYYRV